MLLIYFQYSYVHPVGGDCVGDVCTEINQDGFTVNGVYNGDVIVKSSPAHAFLRFYMFANKDRMPIKSVSIDWDDNMNPDNKVTLDGMFQNARGLISQGVCGENRNGDGKKEKNCQAKLFDGDTNDNWPGVVGNINQYVFSPILSKWSDTTDNHAFVNRSCTTDADCTNIEQCQEDSQVASFGYIKDKTCISNFYQAEYTYICFDGAKNFHANKDECGATKKMQDNFPHGCCIYKPKIQVKDNWGWCNGVCPDVFDGKPTAAKSGDGCYDGNSDVSLPNECNINGGLDWTKGGTVTGMGPYTYFNGSIYVMPDSSGVSTKNK